MCLYKWILYENCNEWRWVCNFLRPHLNDRYRRYTDGFKHWQAALPESCFNKEKNTHTTHTQNGKCLKVSSPSLTPSFVTSFFLLLPPSLSPGYLWLIDLSALLLNKWKLQLVPSRRRFHQHSAGSVWSGPPPPSRTATELDELVLGNVTFTFSYHM